MAQGLSGIATKCLLVLFVALLAVSCGRRGNLEAPPSASVVSIDENGNEIETAGESQPADKPFILDPLLD